MNISGPIKALITADSTANTMLSGRVYPGIFPEQYTLPAVAINIVGGTPNPTKTGPGDVDNIRVQVDCYGSTYTSAQQVADAVRTAIDWYRGNVTSGATTYAIDWINFERIQDSWEADPKEFRIVTEYSVKSKRMGSITWKDKYGCVMVSGSDSAAPSLTAGDSKSVIRIGTELNGLYLKYIGASVSTPSDSGDISISLSRLRDGVFTDILTSNITIDANEYDSTQSATQYVIDINANTVQEADQIHINVDSAGSNAKGLVVSFSFSE